MAEYKWENPHEWLQQKAQQLAGENNTAELLSIVVSGLEMLQQKARKLAKGGRSAELLILVVDVLDMLDREQIQAVFHDEMAADGYFEKQEPRC